ncbi:MAG: NAD(P)/FAD-dependent oxidoreductase [Chlamydiales bacterium]|nr:NAD(P)/FAD-dependent oxidoreductase [Chlamydiales bacterium]
MGYPKVLILGGGFGGLKTARLLKDACMDIHLIDKTNHHLFQPLLYQVASASLAPRDIAVPIREILKRQKNITVLMNEAISIEKERNRVLLATQNYYYYDYLVVAVGASHSYFGKPEWEAFAPGLKTLPDALAMRKKILLAYERAEICDSYTDAEEYLNFVIVGGGPTGVELAGAIAEIAHKTLSKNFRKIDPSKTQVYLIEAASHILPSYPEDLSDKARKQLESMGVKVLLNTRVTDISTDHVELSSHGTIKTHNVLWAAGNQASPLLQTLQVPLDRQGRVLVQPDLSVPDYPNVFVIGDAAHFNDPSGQPLPGIAPVALQQAAFVAKIIEKKIPLDARKAFSYHDKGSMATIGKFKAIAMVGRWHFAGFLAWLIWCFIHVVYLIGFRNRILVMLEWAFWYLTEQRSSRLIYDSFEVEEKN